jgi:hypothetical protein
MNKLTKILLLLSVTGICLFIGLIFYEETYPTTLLRYMDAGIYSSFVNGPLIKGKIIHGEFSASYNNFGTVKVRVATFNRVNNDSIVFQLREKGSKDWTVFNTYVTDVFPNGFLYSFGFPVIHDSQGKTYEFEIYSVNGTKDNAVGFSRGYHTVASQYIYSKGELLHDRQLLKFFVIEKVKNLAFDINLYLYLFGFCIPTLFIVCTYTYSKKTVRIVGIAFSLYLLSVYIFLPLAMNSNVILYVATVCCLIATRIKLSGSVFFAVSLPLLLSIPFFVANGMLASANRYSVLIFFLIIIGIILLAHELFMLKKQKI